MMTNLIEYTRNFSRKPINIVGRTLIKAYKTRLKELKSKKYQGEISESEFESLKSKLIKDLERVRTSNLILTDVGLGLVTTGAIGKGLSAYHNFKHDRATYNKELPEMEKRYRDDPRHLDYYKSGFKENQHDDKVAMGLAGIIPILGAGGITYNHLITKKVLNDIKSGKYDD